MRTERWKAIRGFPVYEVSDRGRVRSVDKIAVDRFCKPQRRWFKKGTLLKPWIANGYMKVGLHNKHGRYRQYVHILVAKAFIPNPKRLPEVNHLDEVRTNSVVSNLEWRSASGNRHHSAHRRGDGITLNKEPNRRNKPWTVFHGRKFVGRYATYFEAKTAKEHATVRLWAV